MSSTALLKNRTACRGVISRRMSHSAKALSAPGTLTGAAPGGRRSEASAAVRWHNHSPGRLTLEGVEQARAARAALRSRLLGRRAARRTRLVGPGRRRRCSSAPFIFPGAPQPRELGRGGVHGGSLAGERAAQAKGGRLAEQHAAEDARQHLARQRLRCSTASTPREMVVTARARQPQRQRVAARRQSNRRQSSAALP